jgi:hypothetical protein
MATDSVVDPPEQIGKRARAPPAFTREETEAFSSYTQRRSTSKTQRTGPPAC